MNLEGTPASLTILLLGPMQVLVHGRPLPRLRSRKALWLLALLVMRGGRPVEREWLAETLWPDVDPGRAASNLRAVLSELRRALNGAGDRLQSPGRPRFCSIWPGPLWTCRRSMRHPSARKPRL